MNSKKNWRNQYDLPLHTIHNYVGQYVTTHITGYGTVIAQVVGIGGTQAQPIVRLTVFTPNGVMPLQVSPQDMYGISPYTGPIPPNFGQQQGGQSGQQNPQNPWQNPWQNPGQGGHGGHGHGGHTKPPWCWYWPTGPGCW